MNDMKTPNMKNESGAIGKKSRNLERQIQKGFQITKSETVGAKDIFAMAATQMGGNILSYLAQLVGFKINGKKSKNILKKNPKYSVHKFWTF
jgi:hypothetical protein